MHSIHHNWVGMFSPRNEGKLEPPLTTGRRSARVPVVISITIHGVDTSGAAFRENTWTFGVNKQGAKIATFHPLPVGGQISIVNPALGRSAKAHVVWVDEKRYEEDPYEVGVELVEAINVWALEFPPEDWKRSLPIHSGLRRHQGAAQAAPAQKKMQSGLPQPREAPERSGGANTPVAILPRAMSQPEKPDPLNSSTPKFSDSGRQSEPQADAPSQPSEPQSASPSPQIDSKIETSLRETVKRLEELEEKKRELGFVEERLIALADRLQSSRDRVEALVAKAQELQQGLRAEVEKARGGIEEAGRLALESAREELGKELRKEFEGITSELAEKTRQQIQEEGSASVEALVRDAGARLAQRTEECTSKAGAELQREQSKALDQAKEQLILVVQGAAADLTEKLRKVAEEMKASLRGELEQSLEQSAVQSMGRLTRSLEELARTGSESATRSFQEKLQTEMQARIEDHSNKLAEMSSFTLEGLERKMEALLQAHIETAGEKYRAAMLSQVERGAEASHERAEARIRTRAEQVVQEACDALYQQLGVGAVVLKDWADQNRVQLETFFQKSSEAFQKQIGDLSNATLERHRKLADIFQDELLARLQQATQVLQNQGTEAGPAKAAGAPGVRMEPSLPQLSEKREEYLELVIEQLRGTAGQPVDEETHAFRKKLAEALAQFQTGSKSGSDKDS